MKQQQEKICVLGGGPTGIGLGRELGEAGIEYDLYEAEANFGGVWNANADCGRVYQSAHLISPKSNTQFPDFPMPDHYPDYPNNELMLDYIRSYATRHGVYDRAIFNTRVQGIEPNDAGWQVKLDSVLLSSTAWSMFATEHSAYHAILIQPIRAAVARKPCIRWNIVQLNNCVGKAC